MGDAVGPRSVELRVRPGWLRSNDRVVLTAGVEFRAGSVRREVQDGPGSRQAMYTRCRRRVLGGALSRTLRALQAETAQRHRLREDHGCGAQAEVHAGLPNSGDELTT